MRGGEYLKMRYISDDGKVFNTEQECCEHEQKIERLKSEERIRQEKLEEERQAICNEICNKYKELDELVTKYIKIFPVKYPIYFAPLDELLYMLNLFK